MLPSKRTCGQTIAAMTVLLVVAVVLDANANMRFMRTISSSPSDVVVKATSAPKQRNTLRESLSANGTTSKKASVQNPPYKDTLLEEVSSGMKCFRWEDDSDHWWTHHPMWNVSKENDTHTCFQYDATHPYFFENIQEPIHGWLFERHNSLHVGFWLGC
jgi:hypothetical protein